MDKPLCSILERIAVEEPEKPIIYDMLEDRIYTRAEFCQYVNQLSDYLRRHTNDEIVVCEDNCTALAILYFAGILSGKTLIPVDPEKESSEIERIRKLHPYASFWDKGTLPSIVCKLEYELAEKKLSWMRADLKKIFLITYTSGSTGTPKGVKHTAKNLFTSAYEFGNMMEYGKNTIMGHCMPMTYMAGILNTIVMPYILGGCIAILPRFSMKHAFFFWEYIKKCGVNALWLSPTMLRILYMLDRNAEMKSYFLAKDMKISVGTAPLDRTLRDNFKTKYDIRLYQSYGLSETLFVSTEIPEEKISKHTVGHTLPSVKLYCADDGELQIDVPWMFLGYTNEDTAAYMEGNRYLSGDLGQVDAEGNLVITGRKKELIVKGGYNINPRDIENILLEEKGVTECAVISTPIHGEEMITCCYVADKEQSLAEINREIITILGQHSKIDFLKKLKELPKNLNGKIDKGAIKKLIGAAI